MMKIIVAFRNFADAPPNNALSKRALLRRRKDKSRTETALTRIISKLVDITLTLRNKAASVRTNTHQKRCRVDVNVMGDYRLSKRLLDWKHGRHALARPRKRSNEQFEQRLKG
jgi:hypothetical protein